jgi:hypothetical protein
VRRVLRAALVALLLLGVVWTTTVWIFGGFEFDAYGIRVSSHEPRRPLYAALTAFALLVAIDGAAKWWAHLSRLAARVNYHWLAAIMAASAGFGSWTYATMTASGSDPYGYVSQADLWSGGTLRVSQPWMLDAPWPDAAATFAPLGYRPDPRGTPAIVPTYAPGLPMLMAAARRVAGESGVFLVVPISTALLVWFTFRLARLLVPEPGAVGAAWLVATSPAVLYMSVWPMSDVPSAAAWVGACWLSLGPGRWRAVAAGTATAIATLIRPNLVFLAIAIVIPYVVRSTTGGAGFGRPSSFSRPRRRGPAILDAIAFALCMTAGVAAVAFVNRALYGSPWTSGYAGLGDMFRLAHVWPNLWRYAGWLAESHGVLAFAGLVALAVPSARLWPGALAGVARPIGLAVTATVVGFYCLYLVFDAWTYLRFVLVALAWVAIGVGAVSAAAARAGRPALALAAVTAVVVTGLLQWRFADNHLAFDVWAGAQAQIGVAREVQAAVDARSVVLALEHSGSLRYYGGRMTLRYDLLEPAWLDRAIDWFRSRGVRTYLLADEHELPSVRVRFASQAAFEGIDRRRVLVYRGPSEISLFDLSDDTAAGTPARIIPAGRRSFRSAGPVPLAFDLAGSPR